MAWQEEKARLEAQREEMMAAVLPTTDEMQRVAQELEEQRARVQEVRWKALGGSCVALRRMVPGRRVLIVALRLLAGRALGLQRNVPCEDAMACRWCPLSMFHSLNIPLCPTSRLIATCLRNPVSRAPVQDKGTPFGETREAVEQANEFKGGLAQAFR